MGITHERVVAAGDRGKSADWNADHIISDDLMPKSTVTKIVAAYDSIDKTRADYVCNGIEDNVEIQAAIDSLPTQGGIVYLKEGTYSITLSIRTRVANTTLIGAGKSSIIFLADNSDCTMVNVQHDNFTMKDFYLDGNKTNQSGNPGGIGINANYGIVENCFLNNIGGRGINLYGDNAKIINNLVTNSGYGGLHICANNSVIMGNTSNDNQYGLYMWSTVIGATTYNAKTNLIIGNIFTGNSVHGILLNVMASGSDVAENIISENICNSNSTRGIYISSGCTKNIILGNIILNNAVEQLHDDGSYTEVAHNITS